MNASSRSFPRSPAAPSPCRLPSRRLKDVPFQDLTHTKIDLHRQLRKGIQEVIFGEGKTFEQIEEIVSSMTEKGVDVLATRIDPEKGDRLIESFPEGSYHEAARCFTIKKDTSVRGKGTILVVSAGTSDIPVAEEASTTSAFFGNVTETLYDVGVAGIHRLFQNLDLLKKGPGHHRGRGHGRRPPVNCGGDRGRARHRGPDEHRLRRELRRHFSPPRHAQLLFHRRHLQHR